MILHIFALSGKKIVRLLDLQNKQKERKDHRFFCQCLYFMDKFAIKLSGSGRREVMTQDHDLIGPE